jgi:hypothetical protein
MKMSIKRANISSIQHEIIRKLAISRAIICLWRRVPDEEQPPVIAICSDPGILAPEKANCSIENLLDF